MATLAKGLDVRLGWTVDCLRVLQPWAKDSLEVLPPATVPRVVAQAVLGAWGRRSVAGLQLMLQLSVKRAG